MADREKRRVVVFFFFFFAPAAHIFVGVMGRGERNKTLLVEAEEAVFQVEVAFCPSSIEQSELLIYTAA